MSLNLSNLNLKVNISTLNHHHTAHILLNLFVYEAT